MANHVKKTNVTSRFWSFIHGRLVRNNNSHFCHLFHYSPKTERVGIMQNAHCFTTNKKAYVYFDLHRHVLSGQISFYLLINIYRSVLTQPHTIAFPSLWTWADNSLYVRFHLWSGTRCVHFMFTSPVLYLLRYHHLIKPYDKMYTNYWQSIKWSMSKNRIL